MAIYSQQWPGIGKDKIPSKYVSERFLNMVCERYGANWLADSPIAGMVEIDSNDGIRVTTSVASIRKPMAAMWDLIDNKFKMEWFSQTFQDGIAYIIQIALAASTELKDECNDPVEMFRSLQNLSLFDTHDEETESQTKIGNIEFPSQSKLDALRTWSLIIAMHVRNSMEDFHVDHLTDQQMADLNPVIRNAIFETLSSIFMAKRGASREQRNVGMAEVQYLLTVLPNYWEHPDFSERKRDECRKVDPSDMRATSSEQSARKMQQFMTSDITVFDT